MIIETIFIILSLSVLLAASFFDVKTREIPDYLSYGFVVAVLGISLLYSLYTTFNFFLLSVFGTALVFAVGYVFYRTKQMGGGDVKLFSGLGGVFANFWLGSLPLLFVFGVCVLFIGGMYTFLWGLRLYFKDFHSARKKFKEILMQRRMLRIILITISTIFILASFLVQNVSLQILLPAFVLFLILSFYLTIFIKVIESLHFIKYIPIDELTEGDWLAKDVRIGNKLVCSAKSHCLNKEEIEKLKKHRIYKVLIKIGIPFAPAIFLATLATWVVYGIL